MMRTVRNVIFIGIVISLAITACAAPTNITVWRDRSYQGPPRRIMVIGVTRKQANKILFEEDVVRQLKVRGTDAVVSYTVMPDNMQRDHAVIAAKMKEQDADAVLISMLVSRKTVLTTFHGSFRVLPSTYGNWRDYIAYGSQVVYTPSYTEEDEIARIETNLYDVGNDNLIWSVASEFEARGSEQDQIRSYIGIMVNAMGDQKLLR